jgi:hypothetical protein
MQAQRHPVYRWVLTGLILFGGIGSLLRMIDDLDIYDSGRTYVFRQKETWPPNTTRSGYDYLVRLPEGYTDFGTPHPLILYMRDAFDAAPKGVDRLFPEIRENRTIRKCGRGLRSWQTGQALYSGKNRFRTCVPLVQRTWRRLIPAMSAKHGWDTRKGWRTSITGKSPTHILKEQRELDAQKTVPLTQNFLKPR